MDWTAITTALIGAAATLGGGWIALRGTLARVHAEIGQVRTQGEQTHEQVTKVESSINNRPDTMSDRVDRAIKAGEDAARGATAANLAVAGLAAEIRGTVTRLDKNHAEGMEAHRRLDERVASLSDAERSARVRLDLHISETEYMLPMLRELHGKYAKEGES